MKTTWFIPGLLHFEPYATDSAKLTIYIKVRPKRRVPTALSLILSCKYDKIENSSLPGKSKAFWCSEQGFHRITKFRSTSSGGNAGFCVCMRSPFFQLRIAPTMPGSSRPNAPLRLYLEKRSQVIKGRQLTHFCTPLRAHGGLRLPGYLHPCATLRQR